MAWGRVTITVRALDSVAAALIRFLLVQIFVPIGSVCQVKTMLKRYAQSGGSVLKVSWLARVCADVIITSIAQTRSPASALLRSALEQRIAFSQRSVMAVAHVMKVLIGAIATPTTASKTFLIKTAAYTPIASHRTASSAVALALVRRLMVVIGACAPITTPWWKRTASPPTASTAQSPATAAAHVLG